MLSTELRWAIGRAETFLEWRREVLAGGEQDRLDSDALEVLLNHAKKTNQATDDEWHEWTGCYCEPRVTPGPDS